MKKINFKGFSLAEFLVAMAIVSIIVTMGITISKKGIDKAYDYYIYNGYKSLSLAIADAFANNIPFADDNGVDINEQFKTHVKELLDAKLDGTKYVTPNNTTYEFFSILEYFPIIKKSYISMQTPRARGDDGLEYNTTVFLLDTENLHYGLIPASEPVFIQFNQPKIGNLFVQKRHDLLPFTIDDGETGKIGQFYDVQEKTITPKFVSNNTNNTNNRQKVYSYYDAFCKLYKDDNYEDDNIGSDAFVFTNCPTSNSTSGVLKLLDPKKVF